MFTRAAYGTIGPSLAILDPGETRTLSLHILLIGISHTTAPVCLRERLAMTGATLHEALSLMCGANDRWVAPLLEGVILSTCNRLELYALSSTVAEGCASLIQFLCVNRHLAAEDFVDSVYRRADAEAVRHLMRVACGLDSMIVGEQQVLGQVTASYQDALAHHTAGPVLNPLFQRAIRAGKRAHSETTISQHALSVPSVAATVVEQVIGGLQGHTVLVMGAGEMGELAARTFMSRGAAGIIVANRSYGRALTLAHQMGGEAMTFERQNEALIRADVVVTATDAPHVILTHENVAAAMDRRRERPLVIVDIAVPRDTDASVAEIPGVRLFDIDDLQNVVSGNLEARQRETPSVETIASEEAQDFMRWFDTLEIIPTITDLRGWAEAVKSQELDRALRRLGNLNEREREIVRSLAHGLMGKFLHEPTVRLKQRAAEGDGHLYAETLRELFGLGLDGRSTPEGTREC